MESKIKPKLQNQHDHKGSSYQHKEIDQTPKKQHILLKFQDKDNEPTLQKNIINLMEKTKMNGIQIFRQTKKIKRPWTKEEDDLLKKLVETKGAKQWAHISSFFEERCGKQCRERWHNHLRNGIRKGEWTFEEQWTLFLGVQAYGKKWSTISKMLEGRTENTLKNHWNCKLKPKKPYLEKRLEILLRQDNSQCLTETKLFQIIKEKKSVKQNRVDRIIKVLQDSLRQFFIVKEEIFGKDDKIKSEDVNQYLEKRKFYDMDSFGSFGKNKNFEGATSQRNKNKTGDTLRQIIDNDHWNEEEQALRPFELNSSEQNAKERDMDIESSGKSSPVRHDIFYGKSESNSESSYESDSEQQQDQGQEGGDYCERYEVGDFCSPLKPNFFESIDLGASNQKKRLFEE